MVGTISNPDILRVSPTYTIKGNIPDEVIRPLMAEFGKWDEVRGAEHHIELWESLVNIEPLAASVKPLEEKATISILKLISKSPDQISKDIHSAIKDKKTQRDILLSMKALDNTIRESSNSCLKPEDSFFGSIINSLSAGQLLSILTEDLLFVDNSQLISYLLDITAMKPISAAKTAKAHHEALSTFHAARKRLLLWDLINRLPGACGLTLFRGITSSNETEQFFIPGTYFHYPMFMTDIPHYAINDFTDTEIKYLKKDNPERDGAVIIANIPFTDIIQSSFICKPPYKDYFNGEPEFVINTGPISALELYFLDAHESDVLPLLDFVRSYLISRNEHYKTTGQHDINYEHWINSSASEITDSYKREYVSP